MFEHWDHVFKELQETVSNICPYVTQTYEINLLQYPTLLVDCRGLTALEEALDMEYEGNVFETVFELTVYTDGEEKLNNAREIMKLADAKMAELGFRRTMGPRQVTETEDSKICKFTAEYKAVLAESVQ